MGRARKSLALGVWMSGERVGTWRVSARGDHELHYDPDWVKSPLGRPLSMSMPLRPPEVPYKGEVVQNYFDNLLPDNRQIRERIAKRFRTSMDTFGLLREIGRDRVGAVQLLPESEEPTDVREIFAQAFGVASNRKYEADGGPGIRQISDQLLGSSEREIDRRDFFRTQVLFWMLAAIDGHAKNFSIFIEPRGLFRLAPRYDVLSAYPVMGNKAGMIAPKIVAMAMAVWGKYRHYRWSEIRRVHLEQTGRDCGIAQAAAVIDELVAATGRAIEAVGKELPKGFPATVAEPIFAGLTKASRTLASQPRL